MRKACAKLKETLESSDKSARAIALDESELPFIQDLHLLTIKPGNVCV